MQTKAINENVLTLRTALFESNGRDKDVTSSISPVFMKYNRNGLEVNIEFSPKLDIDQAEWAFDLCKDSMEDVYETSGYGWDDEDKRDELLGDGTRFLLVRDTQEGSETNGELIGFVHFRFTVQGEVMEMMQGDTCIYLWDIHLEENFRRKGLGRHLLLVLELIAAREGIKYVSVPLQNTDEASQAWLMQSKGYVPDSYLKDSLCFDAEDEGFNVYSKGIANKVRSMGVTTPRTVPVLTSESPQSVAVDVDLDGLCLQPKFEAGEDENSSKKEEH